MSSEKGRDFLRLLDDEHIHQLSLKIAKEDPFNDNHVLEILIYNIWGHRSVSKFISHCIWCAHREVIQESFVDKQFGKEIRILGTEHINDIGSEPIIIICPMTVCTHDALNAILKICSHYIPDREFVIYGENMGLYLKQNPQYKSYFAKNSLAGIKQIRKVLRNNGVFFTYADFVYDSHSLLFGELFGIERAYSQGLISIAVKSKAVLLPLVITRRSDFLEINLFKPIQQNNTSEKSEVELRIYEQTLCLVIGRILEGLILKVPDQWRLMPTLTHEIEIF
ncbi:MAG: hypothetical protein AAGB24_15610 [Bacteroidota bacterium]